MGTHMHKKFLLAAILVVVGGSAYAAGPVANLKIDGRVTPPTCTINGAERGEMSADLGRISPALLKSSENMLNAVSVPLTISCNADTYMTFVSTDSNKGVDLDFFNNQDQYYGLVSDADKTKSVGVYYVRFNSLTVDGKKAYYGRETMSSTDNALIYNNKRMGWTTETQTNVAPGAFKFAHGKIFTAELQVNGVLFKNSVLSAKGINVTEEVDYSGETVLAFNFGI